MIPEIRAAYNKNFTAEKYEALLESLNKESATGKIGFRVAETPVFIPAALHQKLMEACEEIIDFIVRPDLKAITQRAMDPPQINVPGEDEHTTFMQLDFGISKDENGVLIPRLIEIQGFPTLYFFQSLLFSNYRHFFDIPDQFTSFLNGYNKDSYGDILRQIIVGDTPPQQVILLEIEPEKQATNIDFYATANALGIKVLCLTKLIKKGRELFYLDEAGHEVKIVKIYNRVIFDELNNRPDIQSQFHFTDEIDAEWIGHPSWFSRISKFILPFIKSAYNPECHFLSELDSYPADLENYVLKPIFSFAGAGVNLHINAEILDQVADRHNYILQRKVKYEPVIITPDGPATCEIRMLTLWPKNKPRPIVVNNLIRLSKGEMIGVKFNKDKTWVGGTVGFFEPQS